MLSDITEVYFNDPGNGRLKFERVGDTVVVIALDEQGIEEAMTELELDQEDLMLLLAMLGELDDK